MIAQQDLRVARIHHIPQGRIKAFVDLVVNDALLIKGIRIVSSPKGGIFVAMPQEEGKNKQWYEQVRCLNNQLRQDINSIVLDAYQTSLKYVI